MQNQCRDSIAINRSRKEAKKAAFTGEPRRIEYLEINRSGERLVQ